MEKDKTFKIVLIASLVVAVIGLSIAFAALSRQLTINGTGTFDRAGWDIYFENLSSPTLKGAATTTGTPTLASNGPSISNINVTLSHPTDEVKYTVDITNNGDIDAEIESITLPTIASEYQSIFEFKAEYTQTQSKGTKVIEVGDSLASKETKNITIIIRYKEIDDEALMPSSAQTLNLSYAINYVQKFTTTTTTTTTSGNTVVPLSSISSDTDFQNYLLTNYDTNSDGNLTQSEINNVTTIAYYDYADSYVADLSNFNFLEIFIYSSYVECTITLPSSGKQIQVSNIYERNVTLNGQDTPEPMLVFNADGSMVTLSANGAE